MIEAEETNPPDPGMEMHGFAAELYPICRSITGDGIRETLQLIQKLIPIELHEIASGTEVFDWVIPTGMEHSRRLYQGCNRNTRRGFPAVESPCRQLQRAGSCPASVTELKEHLFTLPEHPGWIPYRTSYYSEDWGFCLSHNQLQQLPDGEYEACIDSTLEDGRLTWAECLSARHFD